MELELRQVQILNALVETSTRGKPTFISLVRQAVDSYIAAELARPGVREEVAQYLVGRRRTALHEVKKA